MDLRARRTLVVGGGEIAARKASSLLRAGAQVTVVAPVLSEALGSLVEQAALAQLRRAFQPDDLRDVVLVIAASGDRTLDRAVAREAQARQLPVNVVDDPAFCSVILPAFIDRDPVLIAVGTGGSAPVLARLVRGRIEALLPTRLGDLARFSAALRDDVRAHLPDALARRRFWEHVLDGEIAERVLRGEHVPAERAVRTLLAADGGAETRARAVYLIGAGPNDPELMSFRAVRCLQRADLIVTAPDVAEQIVELGRRDAARIRLSGWPIAPGELPPRVLEAFQAGQQVCVLAYGDAFRQADGHATVRVFEALSLTCVVVPGVM
jgi:uroporphyrin-III C-methyltransferase/precorrin-2 dehydrogenase/sirohydrochlorin ferrochelatase